MKKVKLLGMILSAMFLWIVGQPMEAQAAKYIWSEVTNSETGVTEAAWYKEDISNPNNKMDSAPQNLTEEDYIYILSQPDEECANYLENLSGEISYLGIFGEDTDVVIGNSDSGLETQVYVEDAKATVYGDLISIGASGAADVTVHGDVNSCELGYDQILENATIDASICINGNVLWVYWVKERDGMDAYRSFKGNCSITGTVQNVVVKELYYDAILDKDVFVQTGEAQNCEAGTFSMNDGVLANTVTIIAVEPFFGEYFERYQCDVRGDSNYWVKQYWSKETYNFAAEEECSFEDIPEYAEVMIWNTAEPVVFEQDLAYINVRRGNVTINGDVVLGQDTFDTSGDLQIHPYLTGECKVVLNGKAETIYIDDVYNTEYNVTIGSECINGNYCKDNMSWGFFACENVDLVKNGVWNENVLIKSIRGDSGVSYSIVAEETLIEAVGDSTIGQEVVDGDVTLVKSVIATINQTSDTQMEVICQEESFKNVLADIVESANETNGTTTSAEPVCAIGISIDSLYKNKDTGIIYTDNPLEYGGKNISELPEGNTLEFNVKVPKDHYDEDAIYTVVRQHRNVDGSDVMEQLETTQNGDMLTFESDKFSTFIIVEMMEILKDTVISFSNADGTIVKKGGIDESNGSYILSGLVAGIYTMNVTRENYVSRTYTVEVKTDLETVELDVELHKTGDITGDDTINARDKKLLFNHIAGTSLLTAYDFDVADITGDGTLNARDKKMIYNHIAGTSSLWE